jgi:hypothetical protein
MARVDLDVALAGLSGCGTSGVGTEYMMRVHGYVSLLWSSERFYPDPLLLLITQLWSSITAKHIPTEVQRRSFKHG